MDNINPNPAHIPDEDLQLRGYQYDLDTSSSIPDAATHNLTDDPTKTLGIDPREFKKELDHYDFENGNDSEESKDDRREDIESRDMDTDAET